VNSDVGYLRGLATNPVSSKAVVTLSGPFSDAVRSIGITTFCGTASAVASVKNIPVSQHPLHTHVSVCLPTTTLHSHIAIRRPTAASVDRSM